MLTALKVRQNTRQWSIWYILLFIGVGILILKLIYTNRSLMEKNMLCDETVFHLELTQKHQNDDSKTKVGNIVSVPISQIMSGKRIVLPQDDQRIINYIWSNNHIRPPSEDEYNLKNSEIDPSRGQGQYIRRLLKNMTNGFFVECGALDGETRSNTLFMEIKLGWKGLLIEGDPSNFKLMQKKNRKAWLANTCLAIKPYPHTANFLQKFNTGKVLNTQETYGTDKSKYVKVQCIPLFSLLKAINVTAIDYFSLDVEGSELQVLKTIPFDKVNIRTLSVEYVHTAEGKTEIITFMESHGYRMVGEVHYPNNLANDLMFVHEDVSFVED